MGKSRGGLSTKIHAAVDGLGNPVRLLLTAGQVSEHTQAGALIAGFRAGFVLADKVMCQRFSGHKVKQHFAASRSQRVIYIH